MSIAEVDFKLVANESGQPIDIWQSPSCAGLKAIFDKHGLNVDQAYKAEEFENNLSVFDELNEACLPLLEKFKFVMRSQMPEDLSNVIESALNDATEAGIVVKGSIEVRKGLEEICPV